MDYQLTDTVLLFEKSWLLWQQFEEKHDGIQSWLGGKEIACEDAMTIPDESDTVIDPMSDTVSDTVTEREGQLLTCRVQSFLLFSDAKLI